MASPIVTAVMRLLPPNARRLVQVGWQNGALSDAYRAAYPACLYQVIEADAALATQARRHCELVHQARIGAMGDEFYAHFAQADGWLFEQSLDASAAPQPPLQLLQRLRKVIAADACVIVIGANPARYVLPQQTHWSSMAGMAQLLVHAGYTIVAGAELPEWPATLAPRSDAEPMPTHFLLKALPA